MKKTHLAPMVPYEEYRNRDQRHSRPMSVAAYLWLTILFFIPVVGLLPMIIFACCRRRHPNAGNYAMALIWLLIVFVVLAGVFVAVDLLLLGGQFTGAIRSFLPL